MNSPNQPTTATAPTAPAAAQLLAPLNNALTPASLLHFVCGHLRSGDPYYHQPDNLIDIEVQGVDLVLCDMSKGGLGKLVGINQDWLRPAEAREVAYAILTIADAHDAAEAADAEAAASAQGGAA